MIPSTAATRKRSFSTLIRVKSYATSDPGQERLNGLALVSIHRDDPVNAEDVLDKLAYNKKGRLDFIL